MSADIFFEIHRDLLREGPGSDESTQKAYRIVEDKLSQQPSVLDIGCGPGAPTLELASMTDGEIVALDSHQPFLDELDRKAKDAGLGNITTVNASMFDMNFADQSFDLIWSEGAIYIIGFAKGLCEWKRFLKPSGLMAVSHISWLQDDIPPEPKAYWEKDYPEIATIRRNCDTVAAQGYYLLDQFTLPATAWDEYYNPKQTRLDMLTAKYADDPGVMQQVKDAQYGIDLYRKYAQFFGYVFYVVRKL